MVAMNVWPTDGADGSVATEARWRKMGRVWAPSGVVDGIGGELAPSLAGTNLTIADGAAWVDGHYAELLGSQVLAVTANGLVVVRFDPAANSAELVYRDGVTTPAQDPNGVWELPIAQVSGSALTDRRAMITNSAGKAVSHTVLPLTTDASGGTTTLTPAMVAPGLSTIDGWVTSAATYGGSYWERAELLRGADSNFYGYFEARTTGGAWAAHPNSPVILFVIAWGQPA